MVKATSRPLYPPGKTRYPLHRRLGGPQSRSGQVRKISSPTGILSPDRPACSESLYRLRYPGYGLERPGTEAWCGRDFPHPSRPSLGPTQTTVQWVPGLSWGVKRPGCGVNYPLLSSTEVKETAQLCPYYPSGPSRPVTGRLPLPLLLRDTFCRCV